MDREYTLQRIKDWEENVADCEKSLKDDMKSLEDAQKWVWKSKVNLAEAIIKLNEIKKELI